MLIGAQRKRPRQQEKLEACLCGGHAACTRRAVCAQLVRMTWFDSMWPRALYTGKAASDYGRITLTFSMQSPRIGEHLSTWVYLSHLMVVDSPSLAAPIVASLTLIRPN